LFRSLASLIARPCSCARGGSLLAEQVRSISVERVGPAVGIVPTALLTSLDEALRLHLGL
ncbi:MAG: hypothetical protein NT122_05080, partial [Solirubrobacterales bacterium]|nr:hypothetical protein [Solirubrobacterales bacterium]